MSKLYTTGNFKMGRKLKGEVYPKVGDLESVPIGSRHRCCGVVLAVAPPQIVAAFLDCIFDPTDEPDPTCCKPSLIRETMIHGPLGFNEGWRIHGPLPGFAREDWPPLIFYHDSMRYALRYSPETMEPVEVVLNGANTGAYPEWGVSGHEFVEKYLARRLLSS